MHRVKVLPGGLAALVRYRCTCGHCEDQIDDKPLRQMHGHDVLVLEGFQETL